MNQSILSMPVVTQDQVDAEWRDLSEAERQRCRQDMFGEDMPSTTLASMHQAEPPEPQMRALHESLGSLPLAERLEYDEALKRCPGLVQQESPCREFLLCESGDVQASAKRLVLYWKLRKKCFGDELAFMPLRSKHAMKNDRQLMSQAVFILLPPDKFGRPVILFNRKSYTSDAGSIDSMCRLAFYICAKATEKSQAHFSSPGTSKHGFVLIGNYQRVDYHKHFNRQLGRRLVEVLKCFPMKLRSFHFCAGSGRNTAELIFPVVRHLLGKCARQRLTYHSLGSCRDTKEKFQKYGLSEDHAKALFVAPGEWSVHASKRQSLDGSRGSLQLNTTMFQDCHHL